MNSHALAEARSCALHARIVDRLKDDPSLVQVARARLDSWAKRGDVHPYFIHAWSSLLELPLDDLCAFLISDEERAKELRQVTPFLGIVGPKERWAIWRAVKEHHRDTRAA